ncbi:MAG: DUF6498-containing protein [Limisphaera sp.]|nr:DUF6498-containing protein [Limisphaera sp.]
MNLASVFRLRPGFDPPAPTGRYIVGNWDVFPLLFLFWLENVILGGVNVLRMLSARVDSGLRGLAKHAINSAFCAHYGGFFLIHESFVVVFFGRGD